MAIFQGKEVELADYLMVGNLDALTLSPEEKETVLAAVSRLPLIRERWTPILARFRAELATPEPEPEPQKQRR